MTTGSAQVGNDGRSLAVNQIAEYLRRATENLAREGDDGWLLRVEARRTWLIDGQITGGTVLVATAQGEIADLVIEDDRIVSIKPRKSVTYGIAEVLIEAVT